MGILRGETSWELRLFRGELMANLGFLRGEFVGDLGFSMNTTKGNNARKRSRIKTTTQKHEEESRYPDVRFEEQWRKG